MNVRTTILRACTLLAGVPLLFASTPAHAAGMPTCSGPNARVLADFTLLGSEHVHVASDSPSATETDVCFQQSGFTANIAFKSNAGLTVPKVNIVNGTGSCARHIVDMTAPTTLSLSIDATTNAVCIGDNGQTTTVVVETLPGVTSVPDVDVWFPANSGFQQSGTCLPQWAEATAGLAPWSLYYNCYAFDQQVL